MTEPLQLASSSAHILGVLINSVSSGGFSGYGYGYYYNRYYGAYYGMPEAPEQPTV